MIHRNLSRMSTAELPKRYHFYHMNDSTFEENSEPSDVEEGEEKKNVATDPDQIPKPSE